jgi:hypothetical protein
MLDGGERLSQAGEHSWLEFRTGRVPVLLIAPHGGRARDGAQSEAHHKVNDLYTDELTWELASRLQASAMINHGMDRNRLDCNRVPQLLESAPWMLSALAHHAEQLVNAHGRLAVLIIHGWNVIEPRVDFGIGVRLERGCLPPSDMDSVSAGPEFVRDLLLPLASQLADWGIIASFGLRYPAARKHNLLQAFTRRYRGSDVPALRQLSELACRGVIEAAQIELSVPLRWPGRLRANSLACVEAALAAWIERPDAGAGSGVNRAGFGARVLSASKPILSPPAKSQSRAFRYGMEFYDPAAKLGGFASFRFGRGLGRVSLLLLRGNREVVMFSTEARPRLTPKGLSLGGLDLILSERGFGLRFAGPAILVPDARACIRLERALACGRLFDVSLSLDACNQEQTSKVPFDELLRLPDQAALRSRFGSARGRISIGAAVYVINAPARVGFGPNYGEVNTGVGSVKHLWAHLNTPDSATTLEPRLSVSNGLVRVHASGDSLPSGTQEGFDLDAFELVALGAGQFPQRLAAVLRSKVSRQLVELAGKVEACVALAHPSADGSVAYTTLGFAAMESGAAFGHGAFWLSQRERPAWAVLPPDRA